MNISNNTTFTSRNPEIRKADDIARLVNKVYPRISPSHIACLNNVNKFRDMYVRYENKVDRLREKEKIKTIFNLGNLKREAKLLPNLIKKYKVGNCGESAKLSYYAAKANGFEDADFAGLYAIDGFDLGHEFVVINATTSHPIIIDAWLGFADYLDGAAQRFIGVFNHMFDFKEAIVEKVEFYGLSNSVIPKLSVEQARKLFPELILGNTVPPCDKPKFF